MPVLPDTPELPETIGSVEVLEDLLSLPSPSAIEAMRRLEGDLLVLGAGGKMGPSFCQMARRAADAADIRRRVIAVSRFSQSGVRDRLEAAGVESVSADLLEAEAYGRLPDTANVVCMTGMKFGTAGDPSLTWAMNTYLPSLVCQRFGSSRIMAFSTGNVYPLVDPSGVWSTESDTPQPVGEYAMSALGRERTFQYFSRHRQLPVSLVRLNYSVDMRYGVLLDLAQAVWRNETIRLDMGYANVIWQADANGMALSAIADADSPPFCINVAGPELLDVRVVSEQFGKLMGRVPRFAGTPAPTALLNNASSAFERYGQPRVSLAQLIRWTADWVIHGKPTWDKPTHFQVRDGKF